MYKNNVFDCDPAPTVADIVRLCDVSERTARRWLSGETEAPSFAVRYVELAIRGRIMPDKWPQHWRYNSHGLLESESCHKALSWQELTWYQYVIEAWHESIRVIPKIEGSIKYLMDKLPKADVIELDAYRKKIDELSRFARLSLLDVLELGKKPIKKAKATKRIAGC